MPSGRTSMLELPANVLLATHPACSERRHRQPSRRSHERKLGDQTKDDADKEPREERSCGRSNVVVQCHAHASLLGEGCAVLARRRTGWADSLPPNSRRAAPPICPDLIVDRHKPDWVSDNDSRAGRAAPSTTRASLWGPPRLEREPHQPCAGPRPHCPPPAPVPDFGSLR